MRALILGSVCALVGCSYPDFGFTVDAGETADTAIDSAVALDSDLEDSLLDGSDDTDDTTTVDSADSAIDSVSETAVDGPTDTPAPVGCAGSAALFCVDWDSVTTPDAPFDNKDLVTPGAIALEKTGAHSSPNLFLSSTGPSTATDTVTADVFKAFTAPASSTPMRVEAWIKLESATFPTTTGSAFLLKVERPGGTGDGVTLSIDETGLFVDRIAVDYDRFPISVKAKPGVWMHVRMDVVLQVAGGSVKLWIDDMTTPVVDKTGISTAVNDSVNRLLSVGLYSQRATGTFKARYDDVSFSFK
ncbi:MAG: hypothetical protein ACXWP4_05920 [Polyangiales bacterium]